MTSRFDDLFIEEKTPSNYIQPSWNINSKPLKPVYVMSRHNMGPTVKSFQLSLASNNLVDCQLDIKNMKIYSEPHVQQQVTQMFYLHNKIPTFINALRNSSSINQHCYIALPNVISRHHNVINTIANAFNLQISNIDILFKITDMRNSNSKCELDWDRNILNDMAAELETFKMFSMQLHGIDTGFMLDPLSGIPLNMFVDPVGNFIWKNFEFHHTDLLNGVRFATIFKNPADLMKCKSLFVSNYLKLIDLHTGLPCSGATHNLAHQSCSIGRHNYQSLITKLNMPLWYLQNNTNFSQYFEWLLRKIVNSGGDANVFESVYVNYYGAKPSLPTHLTKI